MSEFFIELFSEEIPANLQNKTRKDFFQNLKEFLEKEIFVNEIKHFRVSIDGAPIKKAVILSESALQNDQYKALENKSKTETLL